MPHIKLSDEYFIHLSDIATWNNAETPVQAIEFLITKEINRLGLVYENPSDNLEEDDKPDEEDGYDLNDDQDDDDIQDDDDDLDDDIQIEEDDQDDDDIQENELIFEEAPDLSHTHIIEASINHIKLEEKKNWRILLESIIRRLHSKGIQGELLVHELKKIGVKQGRFEERGYKYFPYANISIQNKSANDTWSGIERLSNKYKIPVIVTLMWSEKGGALHPGKIGKLKSGF